MDARTSNFILLGIVIAIVLAFASVALFGEAMASVEWLGTLFLKALKMIIVPLVTASMIVGVAGLGDVRKLGRLGGNAILYFVVTTGIAVAIGLLMVNLIRPGDGISIGELAVPAHVAAKEDFALSDLVLSLVSDNIVASMANLELLPIIVFSLVFGAVLTTLGPVGAPVIAFFRGVNEAIMKMVMLLMLVAPIGIFGLVAGRFGRAGDIGQVIGGVGWYMATVLLALSLHAAVVLPAILWFVGRRNPYRYMFNMGTALLTAFSTASSSATLPLTMEGVEKHNGVSEKVAGFVVPLGATINMNGTALYEAVAALFIAQAIGLDLTLGQQVMVLLTATLAAIGAAGIPEAGLVTMVIVLKAVGLPLEGIGLILAVDWLLDRFRTSVNVWGDAVGAAVVEQRVLDGSRDET
ncbi:MAG: dicarboxylate/amino acid:cation symporter [Gammaproteobacteria bacterium]|nr:dicarboxylate/amino acid:cation symporter [Gammaproteobacteria bacterium]MCP5138820.1 dicarboxylate/amino acid:cation symporter [Chromatiales bacterium]